MRLIDADVMIKDLQAMQSQFDAIAIDGMIRGIERQPTIEAEPVIRCKDCKHRGEPKECFMCFTAVEPVNGGNMYRFHDLTTDNGFCNRGEKMDLEG